MRQTNQTQVTEFLLLGLSDDQHTQKLLFTLFLGVIAPQPPAIPLRSVGATLACPLNVLGVPASCTSSQPSTWPAPLPWPSEATSPTHPLRPRPGSPLVCRKSRAAATSRTTRLASRSLKCFCFWMWARMEPEEQRRQRGPSFQALVRVVPSQRPSFQKFQVGTQAYSSLNVQHQCGIWHRPGTSTKLD